ncbi:MAG: TetR family transcriptional regulator [Deltaproteobacteria bacterium]|jgi:AcrR family transcriptional regulator|nr:TetR family transcriptional regulator [Deltaproteobacteria bacterium]
MPRPPVSRERVLDAAEQRLLDHGPAGLVLDAVAEQAGVSKGGLLYHFPSKDALVAGLTERMLSGFDEVQEVAAAAEPSPEGAWTRAYLRSTVTAKGEPADDSARLMAGLLACMGGDAARLDSVRERFREWHGRIEKKDGIDPVAAIIVRLAADGLWLSSLLGLPSLSKGQRKKVLARLDAMTREA